MAYKVHITDLANSELDEITNYFVNNLLNKNAASKFIQDFLNQLELLKKNPYTFSLCPSELLQKKGYRRFLFSKNYVALYVINEEEKLATIMHIFYARRNYEKLI